MIVFYLHLYKGSRANLHHVIPSASTFVSLLKAFRFSAGDMFVVTYAPVSVAVETAWNVTCQIGGITILWSVPQTYLLHPTPYPRDVPQLFGEERVWTNWMKGKLPTKFQTRIKGVTWYPPRSLSSPHPRKAQGTRLAIVYGASNTWVWFLSRKSRFCCH